MDWDKRARRETITVGGQTATLAGDFGQGAWISFPINVVAGATVPVMVNRTAGVNAVLSGIFLGDAGPPPSVTISNAPQGNWVGINGSGGYALAGWSGSTDLISVPGASLGLVQGARYRWSSMTPDVRALQSPDKSVRVAATYYDPKQVQVKLSFSAAFTGNLEVYAVDWDKRGRRETITVNNQTAVLAADFSAGAWASFPISLAVGGTAVITVDQTAGINAVLSGVFLE
ncbi:MAG: hypothetical protein WAN93_11495 [Solirubrobacteraceae bacterium]